MDYEKYKRVKYQMNTKHTLLNTPLTYFSGEEEMPDEWLEGLCKNGYSCAHRLRHHRRIERAKGGLVKRKS